MSERRGDRWLSVGFSVALHGVIAAAFIFGWLLWKRPAPPAQVLAIDATVVDAKSLARVTSAQVAPVSPKPAPEPASEPTPAAVPVPEPRPAPVVKPATPVPPPPRHDTPDAAAERRRATQQREAQQREAQQREARQREAAEKAAAAQAAAERAAEEKAAAAKAAADKAAAEKAAAQARDRAAREADLKRHLAEEERVAAAQASGVQDRWVAQIQARIQHAWIRPPSARAGLDCTVQVTQVPGGEVVSARVTTCNGDDAVRQSIEAAVLRASPLPAPPDPALFVRDLEVRFRPND